jgi:beta-phosphoglucomutase-like phosphatase (HAD superfamily)
MSSPSGQVVVQRRGRLRSARSRPRSRPGRLFEPPPVALETLPIRWRSSFDAAALALAAAGRCGEGSGLPRDEIGWRSRRLAAERDAVSELLDVIAREEHVHYRRPLSAPPATNRALGLPPSVRACLFDLDGVLTGSARVHAVAWREALDGLMRERLEEARHRFPVRFFDLEKDYYGLIHGRPRLDGIRAFLDSRGIDLPEGNAADPPGFNSVHALAARKNAIFQRRLSHEPMTVLAGATSYLEVAREAGLARAVISPSANTRAILDRAGLVHLVQVCIDGRVIEQENLEWKPAPDALLLACGQLEVRPHDAAAFETLSAGVAAARAAGAGFVVGVDRHGSRTLREAGADAVVADLSELLDPRFA